ncbi:MAG: diacylglycerol kinase family protein [Firmicutes bacterium]|nr:diacylglycerol kinase family protein [Bacillota bacterium]
MSRLSQSFSWAIRGIVDTITGGPNMKIHLFAAAMALAMGLALGLARLEWAILSLTIFMVLAAETINTAIEKTVDLVTDDHHPLARVAKDMAAGAVLLTALNSVIVAVLVFGPKLIRLMQDL